MTLLARIKSHFAAGHTALTESDLKAMEQPVSGYPNYPEDGTPCPICSCYTLCFGPASMSQAKEDDAFTDPALSCQTEEESNNG